MFNSQYVLYFLDHLDRKGVPPESLIDPAVCMTTDNVAEFLISNYMSGAPYSPMNFVRGFVVPEELGTFMSTVVPAFRSDALFQANTVSESLISLAFFQGYLTYKTDPEQRSVLTSPNVVMQTVYARTLFASLPTQRLKQLMVILRSAQPDMSEFKRIARLGYEEAAKAGGKIVGEAAIKAIF